MPVTFTDFLEQISYNLDAHDGPKLAYLLRVTGPHVKDLLREFKNPTVSTNQSRDPLENRSNVPCADRKGFSPTVSRTFAISRGD
jgi:hypothetical protein